MNATQQVAMRLDERRQFVERGWRCCARTSAWPLRR
jgi:hypothetical protein